MSDIRDVKGLYKASIGKRLSALALVDDALQFEFADGLKFKMFDDCPSRCEDRYMRTDDNLADYVGAELLGAEVKDAPSVKDEDEYGVHDVQFLEIRTSKGCFTMASHNEHNGYYGGFCIEVE